VRVLATFNETEAGANRAGGHRGDFTLPLHGGGGERFSRSILARTAIVGAKWFWRFPTLRCAQDGAPM
jgi:hypothetical protein